MENQKKIKSLIKLALALILLIPLSVSVYSAGQTTTLREVTLDENGGFIMISCDGAVGTKTFTLNKPSRWVLDISPAVWDKNLKQTMSPTTNRYFTKVRLGQWRKDTARLVVHLSGLIPELEKRDGSILINFEKGSTPPSIQSLDKPESALEALKIEEEKIPLIKTSDNEIGESKVVEIPRARGTTDNELKALPASDTSRSIPNTAQMGRSALSGTQPFEVLCDGDITKIMVSLTAEKSFDVRNLKFPDRLIVDFPTQINVPKSTKIHFIQKTRERLPIGIITYVTIFESSNLQGYNRLVFEANQKFTYRTLVENDSLNIEIKPTRVTSKIASTNDEKTSDKQAQTFTPPDKSSSIIAKNDEKSSESGHTTPEPSLGFEVKSDKETETVSVKDMMGFLPEFAKSNLVKGAESLEGEDKSDLDESGTMLASEPLMIEPPQEFKPLPKGSRPAADMFLTKGESVILPVSGLVRASVGDPEVLVVNVLSQEELLITAKGPGRTTLITWEEGIGRSWRWINVGTSALLKTLELERVINNPQIKVNFIGEKTVVLEGKVATQEEKLRAEQIAGGTADKVVNLIEMLNPKRVLVKVRIVEITNRDKEDFMKQIGTGTRTESGDFQFNVLSDILNPEFPGGGIFDIRLHPSIVRGKSGDERFDPIDIALNYLESTRKGQVLSQPNLVVLSGKNAEFRVGGEIPFTYKNENGFSVVDFREFGIELKIAPNVDSENNILLHVEPLVRTVDMALAVAGIPGFKTRLVKTDIQVKDGQTIVIGGLLQHETVSQKAKVPVLGDIPLIGELFKSKKTSDETTELLIFLTPSVLKDVSAAETEIKNEIDVSISPFYQKEVVEGAKSE